MTKTENEIHTLSLAATSDTAIQIPAGANVSKVTVRVIDAVTTSGATNTFNVGVIGATTRYGTGIAGASGMERDQGPSDNQLFYGPAVAIRLSAPGVETFTAGKVSVAITHSAPKEGQSGIVEAIHQPAPHDLGGSGHTADTLANLNTKVSDATLDDSGASRTPSGTAGGDLNGTYPNPNVDDGADATAIHDNTAGEINALTVKGSPVALDVVLIEDSDAGFAKKKVTLNDLFRTTLSIFTASDAVFPISAPAAAGTRNEHKILTFDQATDENVIFEGVMPNDYRNGSLIVEIFYAADGITSGDVFWNPAFERMNPDGLDIDADSFAAAQGVIDAVPSVDGRISKAAITFTQAQADGITGADAFRLKLTRDADNVLDTAAADAQVLRVRIRQ